MRTKIEAISELELFYKKIASAQVSVIKKALKKASPAAQQRFVFETLIAGGAPLFKNVLPGHGTFGICLKCWKNEPFSRKDLRTYLASDEGRAHHILIIITTPSITSDAKKLARSAGKPVFLYTLTELIYIYLGFKHLLYNS